MAKEELPQALNPQTQTKPQTKEKKKKLNPDNFAISSPSNFRQPIHVDFSSESGFRGLPNEWEVLLKGVISKDEATANPQEVLKCLEFMNTGFKPASDLQSNNNNNNNNNNIIDNNKNVDNDPIVIIDSKEPENTSEVLTRKPIVKRKKEEDDDGYYHSYYHYFYYFYYYYFYSLIIFCYFRFSFYLIFIYDKGEWIDPGDPTDLFTDLEKCGEGFVILIILLIGSFCLPLFLVLLVKFIKVF